MDAEKTCNNTPYHFKIFIPAIIKCCDKTRSPSLSIINNLQQLHLDNNILVQNSKVYSLGYGDGKTGKYPGYFLERG